MSIRLYAAQRILISAHCRRNPLILFRHFSSNQYNNDILQAEKEKLKFEERSKRESPGLRRYHYYLISVATGALIGTIYALRKIRKHDGALPEYVTNLDLLEQKGMEQRPIPPPVTKRITFDQPPRAYFPFKLTLYQYASCPFCCKVRAYLNYNRIPYNVVEVNTLTNSETRWSVYNKLPMLVVENERAQLNDSSMIISVIESFLRQPTTSFRNTLKLFKSIVEKDQKGNLYFTYPDRYLIAEPSDEDRLKSMKNQMKATSDVSVQQSRSFLSFLFFWKRSSSVEKKPTESESMLPVKQFTKEQNELERQWREWVDEKLIHVISPNIYRSVRESLHTMRWFSQAGDWEEIFPWYQRWVFVYLGAVGMRALGIYLKKKYNLNDDVRQALYECGNEWANAIGDKDFLGGSEPNLADVNVYGILTSMKGCQAFEDLMNTCQIRAWFERMQNLIEPHRIDTSVRVQS